MKFKVRLRPHSTDPNSKHVEVYARYKPRFYCYLTTFITDNRTAANFKAALEKK